MGWILLIVVVLLLFWVIGMYNKLVALRQETRNAWAQIDVQLKRRYDLIPNLVETVKGYARHERELFERVVAARNRAVASTGRVGQQAADENQLVRCVNQLLARVEAYPELCASQQFLALQRELVNTEDRIAAARRFYNANVREYSTLAGQFPPLLVARLLKLPPEDFFEVDDLAVRQPVKVAPGPSPTPGGHT
ncbi:MAG: LemA family protein [Armatimonadetes bacterium]|nr:LemA family protein [Armatimonadota bacterium]